MFSYKIIYFSGEGEHCGVHVDLTMPPILYDCREGLACAKNSLLSGVCVHENEV